MREIRTTKCGRRSLFSVTIPLDHLFLKYLGGTILEYSLQKRLRETKIEFSGSVYVVFLGKANLR